MVKQEIGEMMEKYNVIIVLNEEVDEILMCKRAKEPYKGLYNLVGGKVENDEESLSSAYRELFEETGIKRRDIILTRLIDFKYHQYNIEVQSYVGVVDRNINLVEEVNELYWINLTENFFDTSKYAGEGNIGHMMEHVYYIKDQLKSNYVHRI